MESVYLEQKKSQLQDLNIPPRKLLSRRGGAHSDDDVAGFDQDSDPYSSDEFRMYEFKIRKCTRSRSHDWTDCPFAHPGEKARRRDPRRHHYSGTVCPDYRRAGACPRGDECGFAHGVFECWLHPARYRTEACKDGKGCRRKVCFFAHTPRELRLVPTQEEFDIRDGCGAGQAKSSHSKNCCRHCCALSPTSTLLGMSNFSPPMSPSFSPPLSPMKAVGLSPLSRYSDRISACGSGESLGLASKGLSYEDMLIAELLGSLEGMSINEAIAGRLKSGLGLNKGSWVDGGYDNAAIVNAGQNKGLWVDVGYDNSSVSMSPSTAIHPNAYSSSVASGFDDKGHETGPDLGWVNELLM